MFKKMNRKGCVHWVRGFIISAVLVVCLACYTKKIEEAFERDVAPQKSNQIIHDYCRSCHIHRNFEKSGHIEEKSALYRRKVFRYATECRTCHYLEKKISLNDFTRKTRRPKEANEGKYKEFEIEILRAQKEKEGG